MSRVKLTDIETTGATEGQVPTVDGSGELVYGTPTPPSPPTSVFGIDCGTASNSGTPDYVVDGGTA